MCVLSNDMNLNNSAKKTRNKMKKKIREWLENRAGLMSFRLIHRV